jgi:hypothetical protein
MLVARKRDSLAGCWCPTQVPQSGSAKHCCPTRSCSAGWPSRLSQGDEGPAPARQTRCTNSDRHQPGLHSHRSPPIACAPIHVSFRAPPTRRPLHRLDKHLVAGPARGPSAPSAASVHWLAPVAYHYFGRLGPAVGASSCSRSCSARSGLWHRAGSHRLLTKLYFSPTPPIRRRTIQPSGGTAGQPEGALYRVDLSSLAALSPSAQAPAPTAGRPAHGTHALSTVVATNCAI